MRSERVKSFKRCFQSPEIFHAIEKRDLPDFGPRFHENHLTIGLDNIYHVPKEKSYFSLFQSFLFPLWVAFTIPRNENNSKTSISRDVATDAQCRGERPVWKGWKVLVEQVSGNDVASVTNFIFVFDINQPSDEIFLKNLIVHRPMNENINEIESQVYSL